MWLALLAGFAVMHRAAALGARAAAREARLSSALPLSRDRQVRALAEAKAAYGFDTILVSREALEREGLREIRERADEVLKTTRTLVTVSYGGAGDISALRYTPFGATAVDDHTTIYDTVPFAVRFTNKTVLTLNQLQPVIVDRQAKTIVFAVSSTPATFEQQAALTLDLPELTLKSTSATTVTTSGNAVTLQLH